MTDEQKGLVRSSWTRIAPIADGTGHRFYAHLFAANPKLRDLFPTNVADQRKKLMQTLGVIVSYLDRFDNLVPILQLLGRNHAGYGVTAEDYEAFGAALLLTWEQELGDIFTPNVRAAWAAMYREIAVAMITAAEE